MLSMDTAPRDRTRILIKTKLYHYERLVFGYFHSGEQWLECWWDENYEGMAKNDSGTFIAIKGRWTPWAGSYHTYSTQFIDPLGWAPVPEE